MLEVTVKTLDSQSRSFSVPNDITVRQFKERISSSVDIPVDRQRLIYQGRVLQDDAQLNASGDIHGKVVHLVERLPAPAQPTPAEQARAGQRAQQPTSQGNAQPRGPTPAGGNLLGPFPIPPGAGGNFSPQFMQQMIQQALSGMGGMGNQYGPTVVRSTVRHPNAPGGNAQAEIQIHITGRDAGVSSGRTNNQPRQPAPTNQQQQRGATATPQQVPPTQTRGQQTQLQNVPSEPRRQLNYVEYLVTRFEENVNILESGNYEQAMQTGQVASIYRSSTSTTAGSSGSATATGQSTSATTSTTTTTSSEPMEVQTSSDADSSQQQPASAASGSSVDGPSPSEPAVAAAPQSDNSTRHPTLAEVGRIMRRVTALETRFLPFLTEYTDFLENDPAFTSTESPEYKRMMGFLTIILKTQRALALIHRSLSLINIPLVETPPRRMLVQAECPRHRGPPAQARRIHNLASAGPSYLNPVRIQHRHPGPHVVHGPYQVGVPVIFGPVGPGATGNMRPRMMQMRPEMFGFGPTPPRPVRPHQSGLYGHPPSQAPSANASASPQTPAMQRPAVVRTLPALPMATTRAATESSGNGAAAVVTTQTSTSNTSGPAPNAAGSGPTTHVEFMPPEYSVQVTTHIQPQININITPPGALAAGVNGSDDVDVATDFVTSGAEEVVEPMDEGQPEPQAVFGFSGSVETDEDGNVMPVQLNLPNIPGISQDGMRQILESVQNSVQQVVNSAHQQEQTSQQAGRISVGGLSGGQDQVPLEIANIIGQTVQNIVLNHLHTDPEQQASSTQAATSSTQTSSTTQAAPTVSTASSQSSAVPPNAAVVTTAPATTKAPSSSSSSTSTSTASSTPSTSSAPVLATSGDSEQRSRNMLAEILSQISGGSFGNTELAAAASLRASTTSSSSGRRVLGFTGRNGRELPPITRTPNCVNDIVRGQGYPQEMMELTGQENIISLVLYLSGELLTIPECISFMAGAPEPANRLREPLRQALIQCWFDGSVPTREEMETEVDRHSEEARPSIESYFGNEEPKSPDISIVESNLSLYRHVLRRILHLLFLHESEHFARDILRHMLDCFALVLHLNIHILRGTEEVVQQLVMRHLGSALDPFTLGATSNQTDPMVEQMRFALRSQLIPFARSRPVSQEQIDQFVMNVPAVEPPPSPENEPANPSSETPHASAAATSVPVPAGAVRVESVEETESAMDEDMPSKEAAGNSAQKDEKTEPDGAAAAPRETDPNWRSMVPEQWVSVIESDIEKQKTLPEQPPYSEAYLAGMPASKRRKM